MVIPVFLRVCVCLSACVRAYIYTYVLNGSA